MARGHIKAYDVVPEKENPSTAERVRAVGRAYGAGYLEAAQGERRTAAPSRDDGYTGQRPHQERGGEVVGWLPRSRDKKFHQGEKAVVLTTGGFGRMKR